MPHADRPATARTCRRGSPRLARSAALAALAVVAALLQGCGESSAGGRSVALESCRLRHVARAAQCATVSVPEDRARPDGRRIGIFVAVLPANTLDPRPDPLVILAGGPGQAASSLGPFAAQLGEVRRTRDIVLVDQRGTGRSAALSCKAFSPDDRADFELDPLPKARDCLAELRARGVDPAQYTTEAFVADLEDVRAALGYPTLNLWGGSYGTRVAQEYMRRHPDRVRSAVLDGVAPPAMKITLDVWVSREQAIDAIVAACRASAGCAGSVPDPAASLEELAQALRQPQHVTLADPRTGAPVRLELTFDHVLASLQPLTYNPELASLVPVLLERAAQGDYEPLAAATLAFTADIAEQMNAALHYSVTCSEDVPRIGPDERRRALEGNAAKDLALRALAVCDVWPRGRMPADFGEPVRSEVPVLLLSGGLDPVTPPRYAETVARTLSRHRHVVAPGLGHIVSPHACAPRLVAAFVAHAAFDRLPASCIAFLEGTKRPPFFTDLLAPHP
jgi:pimeloyl-ACP methyl ester carboxylesterase